MSRDMVEMSAYVRVIKKRYLVWEGPQCGSLKMAYIPEFCFFRLLNLLKPAAKEPTGSAS
jgi:hypothetical protein